MNFFRSGSANISALFFLFFIAAPGVSYASQLTAREAVLLRIATYSFWLVFIGLAYLSYQYQQCNDKKAYLRSGPVRSVFFALGMTIISVLMINIFAPSKIEKVTGLPEISSRETKVLFNDKDLLAEVEMDLLNIDLHLKYIHNHFSLPVTDDKGNARDDSSIENFYYFLSQNPTTEYSDIGKLGIGICLYYKNDLSGSLQYFNEVSDVNLVAYNYYLGVVHSKVGKDSISVYYFLKEVKNNGWKDSCYKALVPILAKNKRDTELLKILQDSVGKKYISPSMQAALYFKDGSIIDYYAIVLGPRFMNVSVKGFFFALCILFIWLYYLYSLDIYEKENIYSIVLVVILGMIFSLFTFWLSDFNHYILDFHYYGKNAFEDLIYCIFGIGAIEEFVKILPLFLFLLFTRKIDEPFDYILYASASALGFAFIENLIYFQKSSDTIIHSRALFSVVGHMFDSSLVAYGIILSRYRSLHVPGFIWWIVFFFLASFAHGLYDFLLFYDLYFLFLIMFLFSIMIWVILINNSINNSKYFSYEIKLKYENLQVFLTVSLTLLLYGEYLLVGFTKGASAANTALFFSVFQGGGLIVFYANRLSHFDLVKNYWFTLSFNLGPKIKNTYSFYTIFIFILRLFTANAITPKNFIGYKIALRRDPFDRRLKSKLSKNLNAIIIDRGVAELFEKGSNVRRNDPDFFLIKLDEPFMLKNNFDQNYYLIRFEGSPSLLTDKNIPVKMYAIPSIDSLVMEHFNLDDFEYLGKARLNTLVI